MIAFSATSYDGKYYVNKIGFLPPFLDYLTVGDLVELAMT